MDTNTNISRLSLVREYINICNGFQQNMQNALTISQDIIRQIPILLQPRESSLNSWNNPTRTSTFSRANTNYNWNANTNANTTMPNTNLTNANIGRNVFAYIPRRNLFATDTQFNYDNLRPVTVRPTPIQLLRAVDYMTYNSNEITQDVDPIDQVEFIQGEYIVRIRHCGHCFRPNNFSTWFDSHVRCPLCRLDIRDISENTNDEISDNTNHTNNSVTNTSQSGVGALSRSRLNNQSDENTQATDDHLIESLINYANSMMGSL